MLYFEQCFVLHAVIIPQWFVWHIQYKGTFVLWLGWLLQQRDRVLCSRAGHPNLIPSTRLAIFFLLGFIGTLRKCLMWLNYKHSDITQAQILVNLLKNSSFRRGVFSRSKVHIYKELHIYKGKVVFSRPSQGHEKSARLRCKQRRFLRLLFSTVTICMCACVRARARMRNKRHSMVTGPKSACSV